MLLIWNLCGKDLFNIGIYRFIPSKIYFAVCISMCQWETQRTLMHATDTAVTSNGHQMAVVVCNRFISRTASYQQYKTKLSAL